MSSANAHAGLLAQLETARFVPENKGKVTRSEFAVATKNGSKLVHGWKYREPVYYGKVPLPCYARGLFTDETRIIARGYDKFFNVDDVPSTKLRALQNLEGPFEVSVKENGCIILIGGLEDGLLVVCSKHHTGHLEGKSKHFDYGEKAVHQQLKDCGLDPLELARELYRLNMTAVCELCDDRFEEHILEYPPELSGLYLHGLNHNSRDFATEPFERVAAFASKWCFKQVKYLTFPTFAETWLFLEERSKSGTYEGREIEGFVVRAKLRGHDFFFKYKFDLPYLLFRQFRGATQKLIESGLTPAQVALEEHKYQKIIWNYLEFANSLFQKEPQTKRDYANQLGIIRVRKLFLEHLGLGPADGMALVKLDESTDLAPSFNKLLAVTTFKYCVMPISTIGCGKTTTFNILTNLFGWGHVQNDDIQGLKNYPIAVLKLLNDHTVVFADRNNHKARERKTLFDKLNERRSEHLRPDIAVRYVGVCFVRNAKSSEFFEVTRARVFDRGDKHQSTKAKSHPDEVLAAMKGFAHAFDAPQLEKPLDEAVIDGDRYAPPDNQFDVLINVDIEKMSSLEIAQRIARVLKERYNVDVPERSDADWQNAFEKALAYVPSFNKKIKKSKPTVYYYGIEIDSEAVKGLVTTLLAFTPEHHITLGHNSAKNGPQLQLWEELGRQFSYAKVRKDALPGSRVPVDSFFEVNITKVVEVEDTLVVLVAELGKRYRESGTLEHNLAIQPLNRITHITAALADEVSGAHSNVYLEGLTSLEDGEYTVNGKTVKVASVEVRLEKQQAFIQFQL